MWKPAIVATLLAGAPLYANAASISFTSVRDGGCRTEVHRFCEHTKPGGGRIQSCLREHRADLSRICVRDLRRYRNSMNFHLKMRRHTRRDPMPAPRPAHPSPKYRTPGP